MSIKLVDCVFGATTSFLIKGSRSFVLNTRVPRTGKALYSSDSEKKEDLETPEARLRNLLNKASPLRPELGGSWETLPYPRGTVYQDLYTMENEVNPADTSIILFPGQGNQFVGMAENLLKYPVAVQMFRAASEILNYDLLKVCNEGPEEKLNATEYCQPATLVCCLALLEKLKDEKPWAISNCTGTSGYSLGELSALTFAGAFSFENAVRLVKVRSKAMQLCSDMVSGGMLTVLHRASHNLPTGLADAIEHCKSLGIQNPQCSVASYLFPNGKVIGGNTEALNFLINNSKKYGIIKMSKLNVSGAFHTNLMRDAIEPFKKKLLNVEIRDPIIKVYSSMTGKVYKSADDIRRTLPKQICNPVKWEQVLHAIYEREKGLEFPVTYECGPGISLTTTLRKVNNQASRTCFPVKL